MSPSSCQLAEVILYVQDMSSAIHFYRDVLGLPVRFPQGQDDLTGKMWVEFETGACVLALHAGAHEKPAQQHEIVFKVTHVAEARDKIEQAGITMSEIRRLEDGAPIASGLDPAGHRFSIRE